MIVFEQYKNQSGRDIASTKCADCANAIWRISYGDAGAEKYDAGGNCSLCGHCMAVNRPITAYIYDCSAHAVSDAAQGEELAGLL